jgi:hypothetical protein
MAQMKRLVLPAAVGIGLALALVKVVSWATPSRIATSVNSGQHFLPPYGSAHDRFGFGSGSLSGYDVAQLHAGWYSNWWASLDPAHPDGLVYVQLIRFRPGADPHDPGQVTFQPGMETIARIVAAHPGSLWLLDNEPDSLYEGYPTADPILPEVYAIVYHDLYEYIKGLDPSALIANGGIVQPTPCRLAYLDIVLDTYQAAYGELMPVDVWNIHAFILREVYGDWGASTPPGVDPSCGTDYAVNDADDIGLLEDNLRAMRSWMQARGYQDRPLIITEYGVLWPQWFAPQFTPARVSHFMTQTFNLFLQVTDLNIGFPADDYRLVQAWAWYSLSDDQLYNGYLFNSGSKTLSPMGETFGAYTAALNDSPYADVSARLVGAQPLFVPTATVALSHGAHALHVSTDDSSAVSFTLALTGSIGNLGRLPAANVVARVEIRAEDDGTVLFSRDTVYSAPARFEGINVLRPLPATVAAPGRHTLRLNLDPERQIEEPRNWNNVATTTLDLRPDLSLSGLEYRLAESLFPEGFMVVTATVDNQGNWPSSPTTATVNLETWPEGATITTETLSILAVAIGAQTDTATQLSWSALGYDFYSLVLHLDAEGRLAELDEENNGRELQVPMARGVTLVPTVTTVLSSASGALQLVFPAGAVTTPTEVLFTPLWSADWSIGALRTSNTAFSLTVVVEDQWTPMVFVRPVTVTWRYGDADVAAMDEAQVQLFVQSAGGVWRDAACAPYQRYPDHNWLAGNICQTGRFVFGNRFDLYLPLVARRDMP